MADLNEYIVDSVAVDLAAVLAVSAEAEASAAAALAEAEASAVAVPAENSKN